MRLGIFGGTFDPPHVGHLLVAGDAFEGLQLDRLVFVPAAIQPLKAGTISASPAQRLAMVRLMVGDDPRFGVDSVEIDRKGLSYMVDTLADFARRYPTADRFLIVGADVLSTFSKWREPRRILESAHLAVLEREDEVGGRLREDRVRSTATGGKAPPSWSWQPLLDEIVAAFGNEMTRAPVVLGTRRIDVSSTEIRERAHDGRPIRGFVSDAVADYIESHRLYR